MEKRQRARPHIVWLRITPKHLSKLLRLHRYVCKAAIWLTDTGELTDDKDAIVVDREQYNRLIRAVNRLTNFEDRHPF